MCERWPDEGGYRIEGESSLLEAESELQTGLLRPAGGRALWKRLLNTDPQSVKAVSARESTVSGALKDCYSFWGQGEYIEHAGF